MIYKDLIIILYVENILGIMTVNITHNVVSQCYVHKYSFNTWCEWLLSSIEIKQFQSTMGSHTLILSLIAIPDVFFGEIPGPL